MSCSVSWMFAASVLVATVSAGCEFPMRMAVGSDCSVKWKDAKDFVRPTQLDIGFAHVMGKYEDHFQSDDDAQAEMDSHAVPVVVGPGGLVYAVDHHHTLAALDMSSFHHTKITLHVFCDLSHLSDTDFWKEMGSRNFVYLLDHGGSPTDLPRPISPSDLPTRIHHRSDDSVFRDCPWRSFTGFAEKLKSDACPLHNAHCQRAFVKVCDANGNSIPFFEFRWGYFVNLAAVYDISLWDDPAQASAFRTMFDQLMHATHFRAADWMDATAAMVPLCRGTAASKFTLPANLGALSGLGLPGYVPTGIPVSEDADCAPPSCADCTATTRSLTSALLHRIAPFLRPSVPVV